MVLLTSLKVKGEFELKTIGLIDSGADFNCVREGLIPTKYFEKIIGRLTTTNAQRLKVDYKISYVHICNKGVFLKTTFILVKNLKQNMILGTPFLQMLKPFSVSDKGITSKVQGKKVLFNFTNKPRISQIEELNKEISLKENFFGHIKAEVVFFRISTQLENHKDKIQRFYKTLEQEVCFDVPNAFWHRTKHQVSLSYVPNFSEDKIPTKVRPIQMSQTYDSLQKGD